MACNSDTTIPSNYTTKYNALLAFLSNSIFDAPVYNNQMKYGIHLISASAGIEFWGVANENDLYSDAPAHYNLIVHKLMIDMIKEAGADFVQIRTRYPDSSYVAGANEALHGAIQYAKAQGLEIDIMFIPQGLEHLHIPLGDVNAFMTKYKDFIDEFIAIYKPKFFHMFDYARTALALNIDIQPLIPEMYNYMKNASPTTLWIEVQGANQSTQVQKFKYYCDSPYNDVMGIPLHDLFFNIANVNEMVNYAKSKNRILACPDCWLTDAHFDDLGEMFLNTGWREPLDNSYITKSVNLAHSLGFSSISMFYGNHFVSYNPGFFYPLTALYGYSSAEWVTCLQQGSRTSLGSTYKDIITLTKETGVVVSPGTSMIAIVTIAIGGVLVLILTQKLLSKKH